MSKQLDWEGLRYRHAPTSRAWFSCIPGIARAFGCVDDSDIPPGHIVVRPTFWTWCLPWRRRVLEQRLRDLMPITISWTLTSWWSTRLRRTS